MPSKTHFVFDPAFLEAFENTAHCVYGLRLKPYSAWHRLCLESIDSPVLAGDPLTPLELYAAARVCSSSFGLVPDYGAPKNWWQRFKLRVALRRHGIAKEVNSFNEYLRDYESGPQYWPDEGSEGAVPSKCAEMDQVLELVAHVIRETGWDAATVWNLPIGQTRWYSAAFLKLSGVDVPFWTPQDAEQYKKHVAKREADLAAAAKDCAEKEGITQEEARAKVDMAYWDKNNREKAKLKAMSKHG